MVSIGLIIPVLPPLVGTFTGSQAEQAFWYGAVTFAFSLANFFGSPILGALSDRYRPPAGAAARLLRAGPEFLRHRRWPRRCGC